MVTSNPRPSVRPSRKPFFGVGREIVANVTDPVEAVRETGLDWGIRIVPQQTVHPIEIPGEADPRRIVSDRARMVLRTDRMTEIGNVGMSYEPLPNVDCAEMLLPMIDAGKVVLTHAAEYYGGSLVCMIARMKDEVEIGPDLVIPTIVLNWSHDGSRALTATFIPYRKDSNVALNANIPGVPNFVSIKHTKNANKRIAEANKVLGKAGLFFTRAAEIFEEMIASPFDEDQMDNFLSSLFPDSKQAENKRKKVMELFVERDAECDITKTRYGAFNAVCEYEDFAKPSRKTKNDESEIRLNTVISGQSKLKTAALKELVSTMAVSI